MIGVGSVYGAASPNYYPWNTSLLWYALCWCIMYLPFLVTDLYYAYRDTSCVDLYSGWIGMTLSAWLQADGWVMLAFLILFITIGALAIPYPEWQCLYVLWENLHVIFILWRLAWLIVGSVMFWGNYNKTPFCATNVSRYMWANLIIGYVWLFVELILAFAYIRPIPHAVPVPIASPTPVGPVVMPTTLASSAVLYPAKRY